MPNKLLPLLGPMEPIERAVYIRDCWEWANRVNDEIERKQAVTLVNLRNAIDAKLADLWPRVVARQNAYFAARGRYWQGKWTASVAPNTRTQDATEVEAAADLLADRPTDEAQGWGEVSNFPSTLAFRIRIDAYVSPAGPGYVGIIQVRHNGTLYERTRNEGPLTDLTMPWHILTSPAGA